MDDKQTNNHWKKEVGEAAISIYVAQNNKYHNNSKRQDKQAEQQQQ